MKWVKNGVLIAIGLGILAAVVYGFIPKPIECEITRATRGDLRITIDEEGRTRVRDRFTVSVPLMGSISRITLKPGDSVAQGTVITTLSPTAPALLDARSKAQAEAGVQSAEATLNQARSSVEAAKAEFDLAVKEHVRMETMFKGKHVSVEQVDAAATREAAAKAAHDSAVFGEQAAEFNVAMARAALINQSGDASAESIEIRSPVDGRVLRVYRESEGAVQPGEMLVEIGDPTKLEIVADLLSSDAVRVKRGMKVNIERWGGTELLSGTVRLVEPFGFTKVSSLGVEEQRVNVIIDFAASLEVMSQLGDGYRVEVRVLMSERKDVVKIPTGAVFATEDGDSVFVVVEGKAVLRTIVIEGRNGLEAAVSTGISATDSIIVHPGDDVADGKPVKAR